MIWANNAVRALCAADPVLALLIGRVGSFNLALNAGLSPFQALTSSVLAQQVSKHAANTVRERMYALFPGTRAPTAHEIAAVDVALLRSVGISGRKAATIKRLATAAVRGTLPDRAGLESMDEQAIRNTLTAFKGVGPWTAEMILIFYLARPDVFPATDLGIRRGYRISFDLDALPSPAALLAHAESWRPYRTVAAWYLWRANDL